MRDEFKISQALSSGVLGDGFREGGATSVAALEVETDDVVFMIDEGRQDETVDAAEGRPPTVTPTGAKPTFPRGILLLPLLLLVPATSTPLLVL